MTFLDTLSRGLFLTIGLKARLLPGSFEFTLNHLINQTDLGAGYLLLSLVLCNIGYYEEIDRPLRANTGFIFMRFLFDQ
jgi:hypothetical protein